MLNGFREKLHFEDAEPFVNHPNINFLLNLQTSSVRKLFINPHDVRKRNEAIIASLVIEINVFSQSSQCWIPNYFAILAESFAWESFRLSPILLRYLDN